MVKELENKTTVVELGKKTTVINYLIPSMDNSACGICFENEEGSDNDRVIIEFTNEEGFISYLEALVYLLKTIDNNFCKKDNIIQFKDYLKRTV